MCIRDRPWVYHSDDRLYPRYLVNAHRLSDYIYNHQIAVLASLPMSSPFEKKTQLVCIIAGALLKTAGFVIEIRQLL